MTSQTLSIEETSEGSGIEQHSKALIWIWKGFNIRYQAAGSTGPALVLVHGFGASSDHWRKNIPELAKDHRVYAIDLIGFGRSDKPTPGDAFSAQQVPYTFETWGQQVSDFLSDIVREPAFLAGNSIGCVVALQAAVFSPEQVKGLMLLDCALRQIHDQKLSTQPPMRRLGRPLLKKVVANKSVVHWLFNKLAKPNTVKKILQTAYGNAEAVTDELVDLLIAPAQDSGAPDVFWAFINNFTGPLPEDLLPQVSCSVHFAWGTADPWEPIALGRALAAFPAVKDFVELEGVGHCPQDEVPDQVNSMIRDWVSQDFANQEQMSREQASQEKISQEKASQERVAAS
ncbi:MAG: alpha/beta fold hydrolase [Cyanobacteria bacterium P01_D01_bin.105]